MRKLDLGNKSENFNFEVICKIEECIENSIKYLNDVKKIDMLDNFPVFIVIFFIIKYIKHHKIDRAKSEIALAVKVSAYLNDNLCKTIGLDEFDLKISDTLESSDFAGSMGSDYRVSVKIDKSLEELENIKRRIGEIKEYMVKKYGK